jgi:hypothetical protein
MAFLLIPFIYLTRRAIHAYLSEDVAEALRLEARVSS